MNSATRRPQLHVEGPNDLHAIVNLLKRHGFDYDSKPWPETWPQLVPKTGVEALLDTMTAAIARAFQQPIGFVLDADYEANSKGLQSRWAAVAARLKQVGCKPPKRLPPAGLILPVAKYKTTVGVWIMPDNQRDGAIEQFLRDLIDEQDGLIQFAEQSARSAQSQHGAKFTATDESKASLHTWLAGEARQALWSGDRGEVLSTRFAGRAGLRRLVSPALPRLINR